MLRKLSSEHRQSEVLKSLFFKRDKLISTINGKHQSNFNIDEESIQLSHLKMEIYNASALLFESILQNTQADLPSSGACLPKNELEAFLCAVQNRFKSAISDSNLYERDHKGKYSHNGVIEKIINDHFFLLQQFLMLINNLNQFNKWYTKCMSRPAVSTFIDSLRTLAENYLLCTRNCINDVLSHTLLEDQQAPFSEAQMIYYDLTKLSYQLLNNELTLATIPNHFQISSIVKTVLLKRDIYLNHFNQLIRRKLPSDTAHAVKEEGIASIATLGALAGEICQLSMLVSKNIIEDLPDVLENTPILEFFNSKLKPFIDSIVTHFITELKTIPLYDVKSKGKFIKSIFLNATADQLIKNHFARLKQIQELKSQLLKLSNDMLRIKSEKIVQGRLLSIFQKEVSAVDEHIRSLGGKADDYPMYMLLKEIQQLLHMVQGQVNQNSVIEPITNVPNYTIPNKLDKTQSEIRSVIDQTVSQERTKLLNARADNFIKSGQAKSQLNEMQFKFRVQIYILHMKIEELEERMKQGNKGCFSKDHRLATSLTAAITLRDGLIHESDIYFNQQTESAYKVFKQHCFDLIKTARESLDAHRGWSEFLMNLLLVITTLGIGIVIKGVMNKAANKSFFFVHDTDTAKKLKGIEQCIDAIAPVA